LDIMRKGGEKPTVKTRGGSCEILQKNFLSGFRRRKRGKKNTQDVANFARLPRKRSVTKKGDVARSKIVNNRIPPLGHGTGTNMTGAGDKKTVWNLLEYRERKTKNTGKREIKPARIT